MSLYDYEQSKKIFEADVSFDACIMAAMRGADTFNAARLRLAFPDMWDELQARYNAPGGRLDSDRDETEAS